MVNSIVKNSIDNLSLYNVNEFPVDIFLSTSNATKLYKKLEHKDYLQQKRYT